MRVALHTRVVGKLGVQVHSLEALSARGPATWGGEFLIVPSASRTGHAVALRRIVRIALLLLMLLPVSVTLYVTTAAAWLGLWGAGNVAFAWQENSLPALSRGVEGVARSAGVLAGTMQVWGATAGWIPGGEAVRQAGQSLESASQIGLAIAPALPDALGVDGPKRYLICALNDAELFGSGGAPLDLAMIEVDRGKVTIPLSGSASGVFNPDNAPYAWEKMGGLPWYREGGNYPFANSNFHPNFPYSGPNMMSAWTSLGQPRVDGIVTVDMYAIAELLRVVGPIDSGEYGTLTPENVITKVLVDAYRRFPEDVPGAKDQRRSMNAKLRSDLLARLSDRWTALRAAKGLWGTIPGRHLQAFSADAQLQSAVRAAGADGNLATSPGDIVGVFLQSGVSKLAVFQQRSIDHQVTVLPDGSAMVRETVCFTNAVPDGLPGDPTSYKGYTALVFRQRVAFRIPQAATGASVSVMRGRELVPEAQSGPYSDDAGAKVLWQGQDIPPGQTRTTVVEYRLPKGTFGTAGGIRYALTANPQSTVLPVELSVEVNFDGLLPHVQEGSGWRMSGQRAQWQGTLDRTLTVDIGAS